VIVTGLGQGMIGLPLSQLTIPLAGCMLWFESTWLVVDLSWLGTITERVEPETEGEDVTMKIRSSSMVSLSEGHLAYPPTQSFRYSRCS